MPARPHARAEQHRLVVTEVRTDTDDDVAWLHERSNERRGASLVVPANDADTHEEVGEIEEQANAVVQLLDEDVRLVQHDRSRVRDAELAREDEVVAERAERSTVLDLVEHDVLVLWLPAEEQRAPPGGVRRRDLGWDRLVGCRLERSMELTPLAPGTQAVGQPAHE